MYQLSGNFVKWKFNFRPQQVRFCKRRVFNFYWPKLYVYRINWWVFV